MIVPKLYGAPTPETHMMVEISPEILREYAARFEELAKCTERNKILTIRLTREITLAYQVEEKLGNSSAVEHPAVNRTVGGSSPSFPATKGEGDAV